MAQFLYENVVLDNLAQPRTKSLWCIVSNVSAAQFAEL